MIEMSGSADAAAVVREPPPAFGQFYGRTAKGGVGEPAGRGSVRPQRSGRLSVVRQPPAGLQLLARRAAQRFFCASLIRLRAAADIFRGPRVRPAAADLAGLAAFAFALPADVAPPALSRRAAQYFLIRSLTALRCAAVMLLRPRRRPFAAVAAVAVGADRAPRSLSSGNA